MSKENPILGITFEHVNAVDEDKLVADVPAYIARVQRIIEEEQPELSDFLAFARESIVAGGDSLIFDVGVSMAYEVIPQNHREEFLTEEHINTFFHTLGDSVTVPEGSESSGSLELSWFTDKVGIDSPAFTEWAAGAVSAFDSHKDKSDFILGMSFVVMPFYMRAEARTMEERIFGAE